MNSAYSIFKRPILIDKDEPFLEGVKTKFQGRVEYTPNLAQEINLSRIQRQLIAEKGSFDGGVVVRFPPGWRVTFRAALTERQINVDRVSIRKGAEIGTAKLAGSHEVNAQQHAARAASVEAESVGVTNWSIVDAAKRVRPPFTNTDSYSRCFRIELGTTNSPCPMMHSQACADWVEQIVRHLGQETLRRGSWSSRRAKDGKRPSVARYLNSSQLDRKTDCFYGGALIPARNVASVDKAGYRENVGRHEVSYFVNPTITFKAVCGTQTKQGGCLYEWPDSLNTNSVLISNRLVFRQKPGIGIAAVSPVERNSTTVFRPDRTGLRKTPSSWLPANVKQKDHPGFVLIGLKVKEDPFLNRGL